MLKNPFLIYVLSFGAVFLAYQLGWSEVYPDLSGDLLLFFGLTFLYALVLAVVVVPEVRQINQYEEGQIPSITVFFLLAGFAADLIYTGIPLLMVLNGNLYSIDVGVPTLHVFNVTFGSAFSTIRFADYLYSKRRRYLLEALLPNIFFVLVLYRGPVIICLVSWCFVYFIKNGLGVKRGVLIAAAAVLVLGLFGVVGDIREGGAAAIEQIGKPTVEFQNSGIPATYLWTYIYLSSPMANLQMTVDADKFDDPEHRGAVEFVVTELIPDFVSKRILPFMRTERVKPEQVSRGLTVSTIYGRAYAIARWLGATLMFASLTLLIVVYLRLIIRTPYAVPCLALLNTLVVFCAFQNMIAYTGVILQLFWPVFFYRIGNRRLY